MTAPRGPDRRQQPRRHEDALLHYAEQNLLAVALVTADSEADVFDDPAGVERLDGLKRAAATYRHAQEAAQAAR